MEKTSSGRLATAAIALIAALGHLPLTSAQAQPAQLCDQKVDYKLTPPAADVPADMKAFAGVWIGLWGNARCSALIVETIAKDGAVDVWYVFGPDIATNTGRTGGANRRKGTIAGGNLSIKSGSSLIEYRLVNSDELAGSFSGQAGMAKGTFKRQR